MGQVASWCGYDRVLPAFPPASRSSIGSSTGCHRQRLVFLIFLACSLSMQEVYGGHQADNRWIPIIIGACMGVDVLAAVYSDGWWNFDGS